MSTWSADVHNPANLSPTSTAATLPPLSSNHLMTQGWPQSSGNATPNAHSQSGNGNSSMHGSGGSTHERYLPMALQPNSAVGPPGAGNSSPAYALGPPAIQPSGMAMSPSERSSGETSRFAHYPGDVHGSAPARDIKTSGSTGSWNGTEQATSPVLAAHAEQQQQQQSSGMEHGYSGGHHSQRSFDSTTSNTAYGSMHAHQQTLPSVPYGKHRYSAPSTVSGQHGGYERGLSPQPQGYNGSDPDSPRTGLAGSTSFGSYGAVRGVPTNTYQHSAKPYARPASPTYGQMASHGSAHQQHSINMAGSTSHAWGTATGADAHQTAHAPSAGHGYYGAPLAQPRSVLQMSSAPTYSSYAGHHGVPLEVPQGYSSVPSYQAAQPSVSVVPDPYGNPSEVRTHYFNPFEVKHRRRTTKAQFKVLEGTFQETPKPTAAARKEIAEQLGMPIRAVQIWFQNRRAKAKVLARKEAEKAAEQQKERNGSGSGEQRSHLADRKHSASSSAGGGGGVGSAGSGSASASAGGSHQSSHQEKRRPDDSPEHSSSAYHGHHAPASHHSTHAHPSMHSYGHNYGHPSSHAHSSAHQQHQQQQQQHYGPSSSSTYAHHHAQEEHHDRMTHDMLPRYSSGVYEPTEGSNWRS